MSDSFQLVRIAIREAEATFRAANNSANNVAGLLEGRLRHVDHDTLVSLKRELTQFNSHTGKWKS